jgi:formyl-CoA transferase
LGCELDNRNKRSVTLDVSKDEGQTVLHRLVERCDVLITSLRPSELERYRMEYEELSRLNPRLVFASLTGYGRHGPDREKRGYDVTAFWARSGFMASLRDPDTPPVFPRGGMGDHTTAIALACGITTALFARERTGVGQEVDVSLYGTGIWVLGVDVSSALATGDYPPLRRRSETPAMTNVYRTRDDRWVYFAHLQQDPYWHAFCQALDLQHIEDDPRFSALEARIAHNVDLFAMVEEAMGRRTMDEWKEILDRFGLIYSLARGTARLVANPIRLRRTPSSIRTTAPEFGQHTEEVLREHGYSWDDISELKEQGVIA